MLTISNLLSGFIGAFIATILSILYNYIREQHRLRSDIFLQVVKYSDDIYEYLQALHVDKDATYSATKRGLSDEEYRIYSRELKKMLLSTSTHASVATVYGEGEKLQMINALSGELLKVTNILWEGDESNWVESNKLILASFKNIIDPLKKDIFDVFLKECKLVSIIKDIFPTFLFFIKR